MLIGRADELKNGHVSGWAYNEDHPGEHLVIRVMRWPQVIASGVANIMRRDLPDAGIGDGDHAFRIALPAEITSLEGLMVVAQSIKHGEVSLEIASGDDRKIDKMFSAFSNQYEEALIALKGELDQIKAEQESQASERRSSGATELPDDLSRRLQRLEARMESSEVFFVRIDEAVRQLVEDKNKRQKKRFLGIF